MSMKDFGIDRLSPDEKVALALEIWESLESPPFPPMTDELREELDRRESELKANPDIALTWNQIQARIQSKR
jgi:putative addiction module component (TIGR02574 family)